MLMQTASRASVQRGHLLQSSAQAGVLRAAAHVCEAGSSRSNGNSQGALSTEVACPSCSKPWHEQQQGRLTAQRNTRCNSGSEILSELAAVDPGLLQDVLVGGAVVATVSWTLTSGMKKDPEPCSLCQGTGGAQCFACEGDGKNTKSRDELYDAPNKRDMFGRSTNPRECRVCKGGGRVMCSQCRGSGYQSTF